MSWHHKIMTMKLPCMEATKEIISSNWLCSYLLPVLFRIQKFALKYFEDIEIKSTDYFKNNNNKDSEGVWDGHKH